MISEVGGSRTEEVIEQMDQREREIVRSWEASRIDGWQYWGAEGQLLGLYET